MQELELLRSKLEQLIRRFSALQAENERMDKAHARQSEIISRQETEIEKLRAELRLHSVARSATGAFNREETERLKHYLDQVIREIEKNIELL